MEKEQGSLHDRLRDFGREPNPEILASLQSQLAERRGKKRPAWWLLAAAIVFVSGVSTTFFHALQLDQNPLQTISAPTGKDVPLAGGSKESLSSPTTNSHTNQQSENKNLKQPQSLTDNSVESENSHRQSNETQSGELHSAKQKDHHSNSSGHLLATNSAKARKFQDGVSSESDRTESDVPSRETTAGLTKNGKRQTGFGKSSRQLEGSFVVQSSKKEQASSNQGDSRQINSVKDPVVSSSRKNDSGVESGNATAPKPAQNQMEESSQNIQGQQETHVGSVNQEKNNPKAETVTGDQMNLKKDSIAIAVPKDSVLVAAATDSTKVWAGKRMSFSVLAGTRYSAVRYYAINQEKSEFRNQLTDENGAFPSRMSFETGCRIDYKLANQFSVFGDLDLGYGKEELFLLSTSAVKGQFERTVSGNSLILNPKQKTQEEHISASIWYSSVLAGFGIQMLPKLPVIRIGAGMQFVLLSDVSQKMEGNTISSGKMSGPAGVCFLRISASKEIPLGTRGTLIVEPVVQYFLNPVYRMKAGTSILPLQTGIQIGWKW